MCTLLLSTTTFTTPLSSVPPRILSLIITIINFLSSLCGNYEANLSLCTYRSFLSMSHRITRLKKLIACLLTQPVFGSYHYIPHTFVVVRLFA